MMFSLYAQGFGCTSVARQVNALGAKPHRSAEFNRSSVNMILRNPTYIGKIVWDQKKHIRKGARGNPKHITIYQPPEKWTITDGLHPAIVDRELFDRVQAIMAGRYILQAGWHSKEPAGRTGMRANCGMNMQRMVMKRCPLSALHPPWLLCQHKIRAGGKAGPDSSRIRWISFPCASLPPVCRIPPLSFPLLAVQKELAGANRQKTVSMSC